MKAHYTDNPSKGPGHGILRISEPGALAMQDDLTFSIRRASDQQCIGAAGRQTAEVLLSPEGMDMKDGTLELLVGPNVVDSLDTQETYRITLVGSNDTRAACGLSVPQVTYSPLAGGAGVGATKEAPKAAPTPPPPPPPPVPDPAQSNMSGMDIEIAPEPELKKKGGGMLIILLVLLLLAGGGFALWKFVLSKPDTAAPPAAGNATTPAPEKVLPLSQARKHLAGPAEPAKSLELAKLLRAEKDSADAVFLLMEDAAGKGNAEAMLATGEFYDPAAKTDAGSIKKDPLLALDWYTKAKTAGSAEAEAKLAALKAWAGVEAPKGTAGAKEVLEKMN